MRIHSKQLQIAAVFK